jgi:hypothetical protein
LACLGGPLSASATPRTEKYKAEIYGNPRIITKYHVIRGDELAATAAATALREARAYVPRLAPLLVAYFDEPHLDEAFDLESRFCCPVLHRQGPEMFEIALRIARAKRRVLDALGEIVESDPDLARVEIYRGDRRHFARAFELEPGLQAFVDVDEMRVRTLPVEPVLRRAGFEHGAAVPKDVPDLVGYFENDVVFCLTVPVVTEGRYLGDAVFDFYRTASGECEWSRGWPPLRKVRRHGRRREPIAEGCTRGEGNMRRTLDALWGVLVTGGLGLAASSASAVDVVEYYHADAIGNVRVVTDPSGAVVERHDYLPYWKGRGLVP